MCVVFLWFTLRFYAANFKEEQGVFVTQVHFPFHDQKYSIWSLGVLFSVLSNEAVSYCFRWRHDPTSFSCLLSPASVPLLLITVISYQQNKNLLSDVSLCLICPIIPFINIYQKMITIIIIRQGKFICRAQFTHKAI